MHRARAAARRRRARGGAGTFPIVAFRVGRAARPGAPKRSCCRPALPSNGCATTSGSSRRRTSPRPWPRSARRPGDVWFVPALLGLGTPVWDFGARGTLVGLTRGSGRPEIVRAVLEGVAHRGADLVEAVGARQWLPDRGPAHRRRHVGQRGVRRGAGRRHRTPGRDLARRWRRPRSAPASWPGWPSAPTRRPRSWRHVLAPPNRRASGDDAGRAADRERWLAARAKAEGTIPELSGISF